MAIKFRFSLRAKLLLLSCVLFTVPWFAYQYVWEMEKYLRYGQEQTIIGTARALATSLHERPNLFNNQASFLPSVEKGKDLYGYEIEHPIKLDGLANDWPNFDNRAHFYDVNNKVEITKNGISNSPHTNFLPKTKSESLKNTLHYQAAVAKYDKHLYLMLRVTDNTLIYRDKNALSITGNDHLEIALINENNEFIRYIISNKSSGWLSAFTQPVNSPIAKVATEIQGQWLTTPQGYNIELRLPLHQLGDKVAFVLNDVDTKYGNIVASIGSAPTLNAHSLGTILVPSPEIERIVKGMRYTNSSIWVVDQHHRVLASAGNLKEANGLWNTPIQKQESNKLLNKIKQQWLLPLYYKILTKPSNDFIDKLYDTSHLTGEHIKQALKGKSHSQWRLTTDKQAVILSAAYPIYIDGLVKGAVIVEETTNGIRTVRNHALEKLFSVILAILLIGSLVFFIFASRISSRIITLRNQTESAIDNKGRIKHSLIASDTQDEIGDLSRSFTDVIQRLAQYNHYLENMSSRLSHELRTPIAIVKTSLENLEIQHLPKGTEQYIVRANSGISRLDTILTRMSEATRLEQILVNTEKECFDLKHVTAACVTGYQQIYPKINFDITIEDQQPEQDQMMVLGSADHYAQLLDKLINNAVEFSADQQIAVELFTCSKGYCLTIKNKGELLPTDMQDRIFDSMVSLRSGATSSTPHLGLGLYIARLIAEFHQGDISATNINTAEFKGVSVSLVLPTPIKT